MSNLKLRDRIASYQEASDQKLLSRLPVIISINGRGFAKGTELLDKPHCSKFSECILSTTLRLCNEVEGALFAYQHNDEIVIVSRNDQTPETTPWYDNKVQKICSVTSSIATLHFNNCANAISLDMVGEPVFTSQVSVVPNIMEAINTMVFKQQFNFHTSIQNACFYELLKRHDKHTIKEMLNGLNVDEKMELLQQECGVDFNDYPHSFRRGAACYRVPRITEGGMKTKWFINTELPIFTKDQSFLSNIFKNGADIFRKESL
jgi:tRNA(His) 5'-end guanylyltransferase